MDKIKMKQSILEALYRKLGEGFHISVRPVLKTNQKLDGLEIMREGSRITPIIYLDDFYKELENGTSIEAVVEKILQEHDESTNLYQGHFNVDNILCHIIVHTRSAAASDA